MVKKIIGFLIPIVGILLFFKYINMNKEKKMRGVTEKITRQTRRKSQVISMNLNERQQSIIKLFNKRDILLPTDIYSVAPELSTRTLRRDMDKLVELGFVLKEGSTKDTRYRLRK